VRRAGPISMIDGERKTQYHRTSVRTGEGEGKEAAQLSSHGAVLRLHCAILEDLSGSLCSRQGMRRFARGLLYKAGVERICTFLAQTFPLQYLPCPVRLVLALVSPDRRPRSTRTRTRTPNSSVTPGLPVLLTTGDNLIPSAGPGSPALGRAFLATSTSRIKVRSCSPHLEPDPTEPAHPSTTYAYRRPLLHWRARSHTARRPEIQHLDLSLTSCARA
jgi:hypothetical protein